MKNIKKFQKKWLILLLLVPFLVGMRQRVIFQRVKSFCDAQNYTITQIQNATDVQVKTALNLTDEEFQKYRAYVPGIKKLLIQDLQEKLDIQTLADLKTQIHPWLITRFPSYVVEKDFSNKTNRKVIFYLDGKND